MSLKYYADERARHPALKAAQCTAAEATIAVKKLWRHFAKAHPFTRRKPEPPPLVFTSGSRNSSAGYFRIKLNRDGLSWLTVIHEVAHSLEHYKRVVTAVQGAHRWHGKAHKKIVDRLAKWIVAKGWPAGALREKLEERDSRLAERARVAAMPAPIETRIAKRDEQIKRLERRVAGLQTRIKTARRSRAALLRVKEKRT
jgi:hypothetical protein